MYEHLVLKTCCCLTQWKYVMNFTSMFSSLSKKNFTILTRVFLIIQSNNFLSPLTLQLITKLYTHV